MKVIEYMERHGYEQLVLCHDPGTGLRAVITIHDTTLGPAMGGVRVWEYSSEEEAILDALRLAQAMTYKSAAAGLNLGGGKAVIMGPVPPAKREAWFRALGRFVDSLGGRYIATEDVGVFVRDIEAMRHETAYVTGLPRELGGSGDPSPPTAFGVYRAMKACAEEVWGDGSLKGRRVALQGLGKVGTNLAKHLLEEGAEVVVSEIDEAALARARQMGLTTVNPERIYDLECDFFSPCALGGILNKETIPRLKCRIVCGSANNQLAEPEDGDRLEERGILYAPDFIVNAGGIINVSFELTGYNEELAYRKVGEIYDTVKEVIDISRSEGITTARAADLLAERRLRSVGSIKTMFWG